MLYQAAGSFRLNASCCEAVKQKLPAKAQSGMFAPAGEHRTVQLVLCNLASPMLAELRN